VPPPPTVTSPLEAAPPVPVKLIGAPRLSAPKGLATIPLFECAHVKFAWGHEFRGFVVDETGRVWLYDRGGWGWTPTTVLQPDPTTPPDGWRWRGRPPLAAHIAPALSTARLESGSVREQSALVEQAALGRLPPLKPAEIPVDYGDGEYCTAYRWNEAHTAYQDIGLERNSSPAAATLNRWLQDIEKALTQPPFAAIQSELARIADDANEELRRAQPRKYK